MNRSNPKLDHIITEAVAVLRTGGVIAYPTEYCFGLGCDPRDHAAIERLLKIKKRMSDQGVILVASNISQVSEWVDLAASPLHDTIEDSWPGPNTWLLPALDNVSRWVRGHHDTVAMRISAHPVCYQLCTGFSAAIVSTSANRHGFEALLTASDVVSEMGSELDYVVDAPVGDATTASTIRHGQTGEQIR